VTDTDTDLIVPHPRFHERRFALEPVAELDPQLLPWRNCSDLRVDVSVADLLATVANQEVMSVGGPDWGRIRRLAVEPKRWTCVATRCCSARRSADGSVGLPVAP
jgi:hypothetical protein